MVRVTAILGRVPTIRFRKGVGQSSGNPSPSAAPAAAAAASNPASAQAGQTAAMSTGAAIPDIDLPLRYRRQPLSQEEIDHINGGGIHDEESPTMQEDTLPKAIAILKVPKGVLVQEGNRKQVMALNIILRREAPSRK